MSSDDVRTIRENQRFQVRHALEEIRGGQGPQEVAFFSLMFGYRLLAICAMLEDADVDGFAALLAKSGFARLEFLNRAAPGQRIPEKFVCGSKNLGFSSALAAGDLGTAVAIARLSPRGHFEGVEYEDDFLFFHFLHSMVSDPKDEDTLRRILARWEEVLDGGPSSSRAVCEALLGGDGKDFDAAFEGFVGGRKKDLEIWKESLTYDAGLDATEGKIFVEGLAVLRLAEIKGVPTQREYDLVPDLARVPVGTPLPPADSWRSL